MPAGRSYRADKRAASGRGGRLRGAGRPLADRATGEEHEFSISRRRPGGRLCVFADYAGNLAGGGRGRSLTRGLRDGRWPDDERRGLFCRPGDVCRSACARLPPPWGGRGHGNRMGPAISRRADALASCPSNLPAGRATWPRRRASQQLRRQRPALPSMMPWRPGSGGLLACRTRWCCACTPRRW